MTAQNAFLFFVRFLRSARRWGMSFIVASAKAYRDGNVVARISVAYDVEREKPWRTVVSEPHQIHCLSNWDGATAFAGFLGLCAAFETDCTVVRGFGPLVDLPRALFA